MRFQRGTLMTLALLVVVLVALVAAAETRRGRLRKGRSTTINSDVHFPVRINLTNPNPEEGYRGDIKDRSVCPWTVRTDNKKYEPPIPDVECEDYCKIPGHYNPVAIKQLVWVLRREKKENNSSTFMLEKKLVVVGCTCVTADIMMVR